MHVTQSYSCNSYYNSFTLEDGRKFIVFPDEWPATTFDIELCVRNGHFPIRPGASYPPYAEMTWEDEDSRLDNPVRGGQQWQSSTWVRKCGSITERGVALLEQAAQAFV